MWFLLGTKFIQFLLIKLIVQWAACVCMCPTYVGIWPFVKWKLRSQNKPERMSNNVLFDEHRCLYRYVDRWKIPSLIRQLPFFLHRTCLLCKSFKWKTESSNANCFERIAYMQQNRSAAEETKKWAQLFFQLHLFSFKHRDIIATRSANNINWRLQKAFTKEIIFIVVTVIVIGVVVTAIHI